MKEIVTTQAPAALGPYAQGLDLGSFVFLSGQIPLDPETGAMPEGIEAQTHRAMQNVCAVLEAAGLTARKICKSTIYLQDLSDFAAMNAVYESYLQKPYPTRSCVQVAALPKGSLVEIECLAAR